MDFFRILKTKSSLISILESEFTMRTKISRRILEL